MKPSLGKKRKTRKFLNQGNETPRTFGSGIQSAQLPQFGEHVTALFYKVLFAALVLSGFVLLLNKVFILGFGVLFSGFFLFWANGWMGKISRSSAFGLAIFGLLLVVMGLASVKDYGAELPPGLLFSLGNYSGLFFILGCLLMFLGFRSSSGVSEAGGDIQSWQGWAGLSLLLIFSGLTTYWNLDVPNGYYCDDQAVPIQDTCKVRELHAYMIVLPYSFREPAGVYITDFLWNFLPHETGFHMQRLSGEFTVLVSIWLMYLLGREISGARTGLLFAALATFSKWMPAEVISGYFIVSTVLAVSWTLLAFLKLIKKPTWFRFFHWAVAMTFGTYTYSAFRPFGFFMVLITVFWILFKRDEFQIGRKGALLCSFLGLFWMIGFLAANRIVGSAFSHFFTQPIVLSFALLIFVFLLFENIRELLKRGLNEMVLKLTAALTIIGTLIFPLVTNRDYASEVARINVFNTSANIFSDILQKILFTFKAHFMGQGIFGTSALDFQTAVVVIVGLLVLFSKFDLKMILIFSFLSVGISPYFLADYAYNGRAAAAIPTVFFLGVMGIERFYFWGRTIWNPKIWGAFFVLLLALGFAWEGWCNYQIIYKHQIYARWLEALVSREVIKDSPENRVYLSLFPYAASPACQGILAEGHPLYILHETNPIYLGGEDRKKNLVIIVFNGDEKLTRRLKEEFPTALWEPVGFSTFNYPPTVDGDNLPRFYRVSIPADKISDNPKKFIYYVEPKPEFRWKRNFYWADNGLAHGAINFQDRVISLREPFPPEMATAEFEGVFNAPSDGNYNFSILTASVVVLTIGGEEVIDIRPNGDQNLMQAKTIFLKSGPHPVSYKLFFRYSNVIPEIQVKEPGASAALELDSFSK